MATLDDLTVDNLGLERARVPRTNRQTAFVVVRLGDLVLKRVAEVSDPAAIPHLARILGDVTVEQLDLEAETFDPEASSDRGDTDPEP